MREQMTLEVAWASSREGSNGCPGGKEARGSVVMESERTGSMGPDATTKRKTQRQRQADRDRETDKRRETETNRRENERRGRK